MSTGVEKALSIILFVLFSANLNATDIRGKIIDPGNNPVEAVTVVLQTADSVFVDAVITDEAGNYSFKSELKEYRLLFHHIMFKPLQIECRAPDMGVITLPEKSYDLKEVVVKGEHPFVRAENGALIYDVSDIAGKTAVTNAYEALLHLPGVISQGDGFTLAGVEGVTVILNGRPTTMNPRQLMNLLKNTPVSGVDKAEVMYNAPARYRVRGAVINVVLKNNKSLEPFLRGEAGAAYKQGDYSNGQGHLNLSFSAKKLSADLLYSADYDKISTNHEIVSHHTLDDKVYDIRQSNNGHKRALTHNVRAALDYQVVHNANLSVAYTSAITPGIKAYEKSTGNLTESDNLKTSDEHMHNFNIDFTSSFGLNAGLDYTFYKNISKQDFNGEDNGVSRCFIANSAQTINRWNLYAGQSHSLPHSFSLNYGINFTFVKDKSSQIYDPEDGSDMSDLDTKTNLDERTYNFYAGMEKSFGNKVSMSVSLAGEYYRLDSYKKWAVYPALQLSYMPHDNHIFQFGFSSDKKYPDYWTIQESTGYLNSYAKIIGNPALRPSTDYTAELTYILRNKYTFSAHYSYIKDYFTQLPYQSHKELSLLFQTVNYDYQQSYGVTVVIPFSVGNFWEPRITLDGTLFKEVCRNFYDISFDRTKIRGIAQFNNIFRLSSKPDIRMELNGLYVSSSIQGICDLSAFWGVDAGLKWIFASQKAELKLNATDIFRSANPDVVINYKGQNLMIKQKLDNRRISLSFTYKFGGYKSKEHKTVDTSRFGY